MPENKNIWFRIPEESVIRTRMRHNCKPINIIFQYVPLVSDYMINKNSHINF
jgi:hypothetical protein